MAKDGGAAGKSEKRMNELDDSIQSAPTRASPRVALLIDLRSPGGTASAAAAEIRALAPHVRLSVFGLTIAMLRDRPVDPAIAQALAEVGLDFAAEPPVVHADTIVVHNPACLKHESRLGSRLSAARVVVVTHEDFLRPGGIESFDVGRCLDLIAEADAGGDRLLAPVSSSNRANVAAWLDQHADRGWRLVPDDWPNICDQPFVEPTPTPRDRRGRHSRPGFERFPPLSALHAQFPAHAERCAILGADALVLDRENLPPHWVLLPFGTMKIPNFLASIDFFIYFTNPLYRESFGWAIADAIAAGKLVITDPLTAGNFGPGVIGDDGEGIDRIIEAHIAEPNRYATAVRRAQADLATHRPKEAVSRLLALLEPKRALDAVL
jgi:hypothetical protein